MKTIPVSDKQHNRAWLMKHRLQTPTLDDVIEQSLTALAEREGWTDLLEPD